MKRLTTTLLCFGLLLLSRAGHAAPDRPAILFSSPILNYMPDQEYLKGLHDQGFEVDFSTDLNDLTWDRIKKYNVLFLTYTPDGWSTGMERLAPSSPERVKSFQQLMEKYVEQGGGVFMMPPEQNTIKQMMFDLTDIWGAKIPLENIKENDPAKIGGHSNSPGLPLAFTDQVQPSPVSEGVHGMWYPTMRMYYAQATMPLAVDDNWTVVMRASKTARTFPIDLKNAAIGLEGAALSRSEGVESPPLFAIRPVKAGRVALMSQWAQYNVMCGTRWIYNSEVLSRGVKGKPSDLGRLLSNTFSWLAQPSLKSGSLGGYKTVPVTFLPPNARPGVKEHFEELYWHQEPEVLGYGRTPKGGKLMRGLIGAKTSYSSGTGTVQQYAEAASKAGLDYVVFLEEFTELSPDELTQLVADCAKYSTPKLKLLPGYSIRNNIGNYMFMFGVSVPYPLDNCLTGPDKKVLLVQEEDGKGKFTGYITPAADWALKQFATPTTNLGFYNFRNSGGGMQMSDCRNYAIAAVRYYRDGKLIEDATPSYLTTAQATIPPAPVSINEVSSPAALSAEVKSGNSLTYTQAMSPTTVMEDGLHWTSQYDVVNTFPSSGPLIHEWPRINRVMTYGSEEFVAARNAYPSQLWVSAEKGLKEIRVYDGTNLFRRFKVGGAKTFNQTLMLDATIQRDLVVIAEDTAGGKAVSFARKSHKAGANPIDFCSDHVNELTHPYLVHGPYIAYPFVWNPALPSDVAGGTWDGGPVGIKPLVYGTTALVLESDKGTLDGRRFNQTPYMDFTDEGVTGVHSVRQNLYSDKLIQSYNGWNTFGPIAGPSELFENTVTLRDYVRPTIGAPHLGWAGAGIRAGAAGMVIKNHVTFRSDQTIKTLELGSIGRSTGKMFMVIGDGKKVTTKEYAGNSESFLIPRGGWFGFYSDEVSNNQLFINRGDSIRLVCEASVKVLADLSGKPVRKGQSFHFEMLSFAFPLDVKINKTADLQHRIDYLAHPDKMMIRRGMRLNSPGVLVLEPQNYAVSVSLPSPRQNVDFMLPVAVPHLNPRWSAGLLQRSGYSKGSYGTGENRYRPLGTDAAGSAYFPLYVDYAPQTDVVAGHPIIAGPEGRDLFIQVTKLDDKTNVWHISVNNPTDKTITTKLRAAMGIPGLELKPVTVKLAPGEYKVIR